MLCQNCGQREATINITQIVNNKKTRIHLCQQCAQQSGHSDPVFALHKLLTGMVDWEPGAAARAASCPGCGLTETELRQAGRFGCQECYKTWGALVDTILSRVHGRTEHTGKIPYSAGQHIKNQRRLSDLRKQLARAVEEERFEEAARLRDEIKALEGKEEG